MNKKLRRYIKYISFSFVAFIFAVLTFVSVSNLLPDDMNYAITLFIGVGGLALMGYLGYGMFKK